MQPLDPRTFLPGLRLPKSLYTRQGVKLLARGTVLNDAMCRTLGQMQHTHLFAADSIEELAEVLAASSEESPLIGDAADADLVTTGGVLALQQGELVEEHHIDAYSHGVYRLSELREHRRVRARRMRLAEQIVAERQQYWGNLVLRVERKLDPVVFSPADPSGWPDRERLADFRDARVRMLRKVLGRILAGLKTSVAEPMALVDELIEKLRRYPERYAQLALLAPRTHDHLAEHAYATAVLAVATSARMGWSEIDVRQAGIAALLSDVGMGLIPRDVRSAERPLTEIETNRVFRHPTQGVVLLDVMDDLPDIVRLAVYQHHERENGAGYPNAIKGAKISDIAKVVAVADAFAAATEPRPYRRRKRPYDALEELIQLGSQGMYDRRGVRALVESTGLFPVGSFVRLSSGQVAQVIGAHAEMIDRPIVFIPTKRTDPRATPESVDLAAHKPWEIHVIQAADEPVGWAA